MPFARLGRDRQMKNSCGGHDASIHGVSSIICDLALLSDDWTALEDTLMRSTGNPLTCLRPELSIERDRTLPVRIGDVVAFRPLEAGPFQTMETAWGARVPLHAGQLYLGVLGETCSLEHFTSKLEPDAVLREPCLMHLAGDPGIVSHVTSCSPRLRQSAGNGTAAQVEVLGRVRDLRHGRTLNTLDSAASSMPQPPECRPAARVVLVGTGPNVGKTAATCALLSALARTHACAAVKVSGTGGFEDSVRHLAAGARLALTFIMLGLPSTYGIAPDLFRAAGRRLIGLAENPADLPIWCLPPAERDRPRARPDLTLVELGGDLIEAGGPDFLSDRQCMESVAAIVICSESVVGAIGALEIARSCLPSGISPAIYLSLWGCTPQAFYARSMPLLARREIDGVLDVNKPAGDLSLPFRYASAAGDILSADECAKHILRTVSDRARARL
jgi:hypothetical protein